MVLSHTSDVLFYKRTKPFNGICFPIIIIVVVNRGD